MLSAEMLVLGGLAADHAEARTRIEEAIASGRAAETFQRMIVALGGPNDLVERPDRHLRGAPVIRAVHPERAGHVQRVATRDVGIAVVALGGGRTRPHDPVDHAVGLTRLAELGERVDGERPLGFVHAQSEAAAEAAARALRAAYEIGDSRVEPRPVVLQRIGAAA
jgi:thymidine phosphorylase